MKVFSVRSVRAALFTSLAVAMVFGSAALAQSGPSADPVSVSLGGVTAPGPLTANPFDHYVSATAADASGGFQASDMQGSLWGTPGLWNTQFAETLAPGQASVGVYAERFSLAPGGLVFTQGEEGFTFGITRWLELTLQTSPYRRVRLTHPEELTFGPSGTLTSFNPQAPFIRNPLVIGSNTWGIGATIGLLSQDRGDKIGLALQFLEQIPYHQNYAQGVNFYGVNTTEPIFQENVLIDKRIASSGEMAFNFGYQHNGTADPGGTPLLRLRDQFNYDIGEIFPLHSRLQGIIELNGSLPFGVGANSLIYGPQRPLNLTFGIRFNPKPWMGLNAGYRLAGHSPNTNFSGWVFGMSFGPAPAVAAPPPPPAPMLACQVDQSPVQPGAAVHISTTVTPSAQNYNYTWTSTGGRLTPSNDTATLDTTGLAPGMYTVTARVSGPSGNADCQGNVEVRVPPQNPPTAACAVEPSSVLPGAAMTFTGNASSPDNRPLTYAWSVSPVNAGHLDTTSQATVHLDTTGATPGPVTATLRVSDDRGLSASCSANGTIQNPPPPPQASLATTLQFKPNSSRVDNAAKAALDDVALRLQQDASASAVIVGMATPDEVVGRHHLSDAATTKLAEERAVNAKAYLVQEKGIASDRIQVRQASGTAQQAQVWVVPQGASYAGSGDTFDENAVKPAPARRRVVRHKAASHAPASR